MTKDASSYTDPTMKTWKAGTPCRYCGRRVGFRFPKNLTTEERKRWKKKEYKRRAKHPETCYICAKLLKNQRRVERRIQDLKTLPFWMTAKKPEDSASRRNP